MNGLYPRSVSTPIQVPMTHLLVVPAVHHQYADGLKISAMGRKPH